MLHVQQIRTPVIFKTYPKVPENMYNKYETPLNISINQALGKEEVREQYLELQQLMTWDTYFNGEGETFQGNGGKKARVRERKICGHNPLSNWTIAVFHSLILDTMCRVMITIHQF